jgi:phage/plasmid-like protein (TIGR03299 family)
MANKATIAYRVEDGQPWIGLPGVATKGDIDQMFVAAGLANWDVRKREILTDARTDSPDFEVIRTNPTDGGIDRLSMAKERYTSYQNEEVKEFAKALVHGDVTPVAMGALSGGRRIFMQFQIGEDTVVKGTDDEVSCFLNLRTSHDGSWAFGTTVGNMRLRCQNMLTSIRANALSSFTIRHTKSMEGRIEDARVALGLSVKSNAEFLKDMEVLAQSTMTENKFWELVKSIYPEPKKDVRGSKAKWDTKTGQIMSVWHGDTLDGLDDTAYKAYNALNEHLMWYPTVRAGNVEGALVRASGMDDLTNKHNLGLYRKVLAAA